MVPISIAPAELERQIFKSLIRHTPVRRPATADDIRKMAEEAVKDIQKSLTQE